MALEVNGKLEKIMTQVTGEGAKGPWVKQEFVIVTFDQYPKKVCCSVWGDKVDQLRRFQPGDDIKVSFNLESREYNERWFTEVRVWKLDQAGAISANPQQAMPSSQASVQSAPTNMPGQNFQQAAPASDAPNFFESGDDTNDLPF